MHVMSAMLKGSIERKCHGSWEKKLLLARDSWEALGRGSHGSRGRRGCQVRSVHVSRTCAECSGFAMALS